MGCGASLPATHLGEVKPGYEKVKTGFERIFELGLVKNAQLCVFVGEECVVDLCGTTKTK